MSIIPGVNGEETPAMPSTAPVNFRLVVLEMERDNRTAAVVDEVAGIGQRQNVPIKVKAHNKPLKNLKADNSALRRVLGKVQYFVRLACQPDVAQIHSVDRNPACRDETFSAAAFLARALPHQSQAFRSRRLNNVVPAGI